MTPRVVSLLPRIIPHICDLICVPEDTVEALAPQQHGGAIPPEDPILLLRVLRVFFLRLRMFSHNTSFAPFAYAAEGSDLTLIPLHRRLSLPAPAHVSRARAVSANHASNHGYVLPARRNLHGCDRASIGVPTERARGPVYIVSLSVSLSILPSLTVPLSAPSLFPFQSCHATKCWPLCPWQLFAPRPTPRTTRRAQRDFSNTVCAYKTAWGTGLRCST